MKLLEIKKNVFWMALNKGGLIYYTRTKKISEIIFEDFSDNKLILYTKEDFDFLGRVSKVSDSLFRFTYKDGDTSRIFLFNSINKSLVELSYDKTGIPINIFSDNYIIFGNDHFKKIYNDVYQSKYLFDLKLETYFYIGNDDFLLCHFHRVENLIQCISPTDGTPLWTWTTKDKPKYQYEHMGKLRLANIVPTLSTLVDDKCLLGISKNGVVALDVTTGKVLYEDLLREYYDSDIFKVAGDKYFQIFWKDYGDPILRCADVHTGTELYRRRIKDIAPFTSDENLRHLCASGIKKLFAPYEKYVLVMDWEYLYILDAESGDLVDHIKVPFLDGVPNGLRTEPMMYDNKIYIHAASTTDLKYDLYIFEMDDAQKKSDIMG